MELQYSRRCRAKHSAGRVTASPTCFIALHHYIRLPFCVGMHHTFLTARFHSSLILHDMEAMHNHRSEVVIDSVASPCVSHMQNHTSQTQVGDVFSAISPAPRLAIATHLSVNEYSIVPIISAIRSTYPVGPLAIAQDLVAWDISPSNITQRRYIASVQVTCLLSQILILHTLTSGTSTIAHRGAL